MEDEINDLLDGIETGYDKWRAERDKIDNKETLEEYKDTLKEFTKYYRKHMFDDDQTICKGYSETIKILKDKIKELEARGKQK